MSNITVREIAKAAGVSTATVSRVLNNRGNVAPLLEAKVREALKRLNYRHPSPKKPMKKKRTMIGLIIADATTDFAMGLIKTINQRVQEAGYSLLVGISDEDPRKENEHLQTLKKCNAAGIIINTTGGNDEMICAMSHHTPLVLINRRVSGASLSCDLIDTDNVAGAVMMTRYLIEQGHSNIGVINGNTQVSSGRERAEGFFRAMREIGVTDSASYPLQYEGDYAERTGQYGTKYLMSQLPAPTAIVAMNDLIMAGAMKYLANHKIRVPEDMSIIGYGDMSNSSLFCVKPHYITQNAVSSGRKAIDYLLERIKTPHLTNREIIFTSSIVEGNSVKQLL